MKIDRFVCTMAAASAILGGVPAVASCNGKNQSFEQKEEMKGGPGGPQLGKPAGGGPAIDKSSDSTLQAMIRDVIPEFRQFEYTDVETGKTMKYNLFTPKNVDTSKKYLLCYSSPMQALRAMM